MRQILSEEYDFLIAISTRCGIDLGGHGLNDSILVEPLNDGGMGSLRFRLDPLSDDKRLFGRIIIEGEFNDDDGTLVSLAVYVDTEGKIFELDIWKVDFSALITFPALRVPFRFRIPATIS